MRGDEATPRQARHPLAGFTRRARTRVVLMYDVSPCRLASAQARAPGAASLGCSGLGGADGVGVGSVGGGTMQGATGSEGLPLPHHAHAHSFGLDGADTLGLGGPFSMNTVGEQLVS